MKTINTISLLFASLFALILSAAENLPPVPNILNPAMKSYTFRSGNAAAAKIVPVKGMPFAEAWKIIITKQTNEVYDIQLNSPSKFPLKIGDKGVISFYARCLDAENGEIDVIFESGPPKWSKFLNQRILITNQWKEYKLLFDAKAKYTLRGIESYPAGDTHVGFNFGLGPQTIEIAEVKGYNYGKDLSLSDVNFYHPVYEGMETDAKWRTAAKKRIEKIRKGNFLFKVVNARGNPVSGAEISIKMLRHKFPFGCCLNRWRFKDKPAVSQPYRNEFKKLFNMAVFETGMKWGKGWSMNKDIQKITAWLKQNDIDLRGHTLIWPSWKYLPPYLKKLSNNKAGLRETVRDHIYYTAGMTKGDTVEWDVMNEPYKNHDLMDILGEKVMVEWYKTAKQASPDNKMMINDYGILTQGNNLNHPHIIHYEKTIDFLIKNGAPLEGIGMQSHFEGNVTSPKNVLKLLDRFSKFNIPIKITEYDLISNDENFEACYLRDFMTAAFSHPSVNGFLIWGFWDGCHWKKDAAIFRKDWSLKPSGKIYKELVFKHWWTNLTGNTDLKGNYSDRGFFGKYTVTVKYNNKSFSKNIEFTRSGQNFLISIK